MPWQAVFQAALEKQALTATHSGNALIFEPRMAVKQQEDSAVSNQLAPAKPPPMFKVLLLNDDYTPMEFVIGVLQRIFHLELEKATVIMLKVHNEGAGVAGIYPRDIAETKVSQVMAYARNHQHPLQCVMEEE